MEKGTCRLQTVPMVPNKRHNLFYCFQHHLFLDFTRFISGFNDNVVLSAYADDVFRRDQHDINTLISGTDKYSVRVKWGRNEALAVSESLSVLPASLTRTPIKYHGIYLRNQYIEKKTKISTNSTLRVEVELNQHAI